MGCFARFDKQKDHQTLLKATALASSRFSFRLELYGMGSLENELRNLTHELGIEDRVEFKGWVKKAQSILPMLDIVCQTSVEEGFSSSLAEAQMYGIPVVTTDASGCSEIVEHGNTGFVVPVGDHHACAKAITNLLNDRSLRMRFGRNARMRAKKCFGVKRMVRSYEEIFVSLTK